MFTLKPEDFSYLYVRTYVQNSAFLNHACAKRTATYILEYNDIDCGFE